MNCEEWQCCCNCKRQIEIRKHPKNTGDAKGSIDEVFGYGCCLFDVVVFSESKHGCCEMYTVRV